MVCMCGWGMASELAGTAVRGGEGVLEVSSECPAQQPAVLAAHARRPLLIPLDQGCRRGLHVLLDDWVGSCVDVGAKSPAFTRARVFWFGAVEIVSPDVAAPRQFWQPDGMPHTSDSLQERPAQPFGGVLSTGGGGVVRR